MRGLLNACLNLGLAAASVVGAIVLIEGSARWLAVEVPFFLYPSPQNCLRRSALVSQDFRPRCEGLLSRTSFRTNAMGLRGAEIGDEDAIRILTLGDSCTWGWGVADGESYPARLQELLDYRWGAGRYRVINAGVPGTTSYQGLRFLRARGLALRPAMVIAAYGFNDGNVGGDVETQIAREAAALPLLHVNDWLTHHSRAYKWLRWRLWDQQAKSPTTRVPPDKYARNLTEIVQVSRAHGAAVLFVAFGAPPTHGEARRKVAAELGVPMIQYSGPRIDLVHPSADGYRDLAAQILDRITVNGMLEQLRPPTP